MTVYLISYDLKKPDRDYSGLYDAIKSFQTWWHYLESTWIIKSEKTSKEIFDIIKPHIDKNDHLIIIQVTNDYKGWLPPKAWEWIKREL